MNDTPQHSTWQAGAVMRYDTDAAFISDLDADNKGKRAAPGLPGPKRFQTPFNSLGR